MRREALYLHDIIEATGHLAEFLAGIDEETFHPSQMVRSAVVHKLTVIGEAAARLLEGLKNRHAVASDRRVRNILVHAYFGIDWDEVWRVARNRCPVLREQIAAVAEAEGLRLEHE